MSANNSQGPCMATTQLNQSTAKQLYSFSKAKRFDQSMKSLNDNVSYNIPSTKTARATSFGYGPKILDTNR